MAKGLRASVTKRNKAKLRDRVFGPVEAARTERLSAKLLELARQPKPTRDTDMLVDGQAVVDTKSVEDNEGGEKDQAVSAEGQSLALPPFALSCPVPRSLMEGCPAVERSETGAASGSEEEGGSSDEDAMDAAEEGDADGDMFYTLLGLSVDIAGFDMRGGLKMLFEH